VPWDTSSFANVYGHDPPSPGDVTARGREQV
jgi:hypothetical protein